MPCQICHIGVIEEDSCPMLAALEVIMKQESFEICQTIQTKTLNSLSNGSEFSTLINMNSLVINRHLKIKDPWNLIMEQFTKANGIRLQVKEREEERKFGEMEPSTLVFGELIKRMVRAD